MVLLYIVCEKENYQCNIYNDWEKSNQRHWNMKLGF